MSNLKDYTTNVPAEPLELYTDSGLCPIYLDQVLHNRYKIFNKLGVGGFSTVWAARDILTNTNVSVKIIASGDSQVSKELRILQLIKDDVKPHPGRQHLPKLLDSFHITILQRTNLVLVLELLGPSVWDVVPYPPQGRLDRSPSLCTQLLLAVDYLHSRGIVHGDIYEQNLLFVLPDTFKYDIETKVHRGDVVRKGGGPIDERLPKYVVMPFEFDPQEYESRFRELTQLKLIDFSTSFFVDDPPESIHVVKHMSPPELIFQKTLSTKIDIWSIGCMAFYFAAGEELFYTSLDKRDLIPQIHRFIGESSAHWLLTALVDAVHSNVWSDKLEFSQYEEIETLEKTISDFCEISTDEIVFKKLVHYIRRALVADPAKRATTEQLLTEDWVQTNEAKEEA